MALELTFQGDHFVEHLNHQDQGSLCQYHHILGVVFRPRNSKENIFLSFCFIKKLQSTLELVK